VVKILSMGVRNKNAKNDHDNATMDAPQSCKVPHPVGVDRIAGPNLHRITVSEHAAGQIDTAGVANPLNGVRSSKRPLLIRVGGRITSPNLQLLAVDIIAKIDVETFVAESDQGIAAASPLLTSRAIARLNGHGTAIRV